MSNRRFLVCPKCGVRRFFLKNSKSERLVVNISDNHEIIPINESQKIEGFDTDTLYCLGCSWKGTVKQLIKYLIIK